MDVPSAAEPLLALPPARFTAERDALARALAARGDPAAAAVRRLRRPVGLAWILNRVARERRSDLDALLAAGDRLRAGQRRAISGGGADAMRAADAEVRERARALRTAAAGFMAEQRPPTAAVLSRLELLLRTVAPRPGPARDALRRGVLQREPETGGGELSGLTVLSGGLGAAPATPAREHSGREARAPARAGRTTRAERGRREREERERRAAERRSEQQARAARRAKEEQVAKLRRDAAATEERARRLEREAVAAEARARAAREGADEARGAAERARARADEAERRG